MNIVLINHYAGPPDLCPAYRPNHLAREWTRKGHRVAIVHASNSHLFTGTAAFTKPVTRSIHDRVEYFTLKTPAYRGNGVGRVVNMFAFVFRLWKHGPMLFETIHPHAVVAGSTYLLDSVPAIHFSRRYHCDAFREVRDLWPLTLIEVGRMSRFHPLVVLLQWAEHYSYANSAGLITTLERSLPHMTQHRLSPEKWRFIPQGVDEIEWRRNSEPAPESHRVVLGKLKAEGTFIVGYTGSLGHAYSLSTVIQSARALMNEKVVFVFVGQGPVKAELEQGIRDFGLSNVLFLPVVSKRQLPDLLGMLDAGLMSWARRPIFRFGVSPNKLMDYMMAGLTVIYAISEGNNIVADAGCGFSVPAEDAEALTQAVLKLKGLSKQERESMGQRGKQYVLEHHSYEILAQCYLQVFEELGSNSPPNDRRPGAAKVCMVS